MVGERKKEREAKDRREREGEESGLSNDILSVCPGYCLLGETTPVIAVTLAGRVTHAHTLDQNSLRYTHKRARYLSLSSYQH